MTDATTASLLERIDSPSDLRLLDEQQLPELATQVRRFLIDSVARSGGHLAAGLGTVELAIALHYVFDTPRDALVWDIGHQCYPHKILTGRRDELQTIRRRGGLSGFLRRDESSCDAFGAGHSSTSISAALGMAIANARLGLDSKSVAVIGDGALTAGLAYEALDHAGDLDVDLLVVLNDNGMSISPNVGGLSNHLRSTARSFFESLGIAYVGPIDGHDLPLLTRTLQSMRSQQGPRLLHVLTDKGHGYAPAIDDPVKYHGVSPFDPERGIVNGSAKSAPTYTQVFAEWLCQAAEVDPRLIAITPAMREGSGLVRFSQQFPDRYLDVGIAEQHSVTLAAGLACSGMKPVVAIYSTFLQRAYDQLIHDVAIQNLSVLFAIDRAGLVGPDGATHNGSFDLSYLRCVPNMIVMTPADAAELRNMLATGFAQPGPVAVRYPRTTAAGAGICTPPQLLPLGTGQLRRSGKGIAFLAFGPLVHEALEVAETIDATVVNMRFVKPLDERMVMEMARTHDLLVTLEENVVAGGAGSAVAEYLVAHGMTTPVLMLGLPDRFSNHGTREEVLQEAGLDCDGILAAIGKRRAADAANDKIAACVRLAHSESKRMMQAQRRRPNRIGV